MKTKPLIRIGTRGSQLALAQSEMIRKRLSRLHPDHEFVLVVLKTSGDIYQSVELFRQNRIGVFTREIEKALLDRKIDIAVHSLKDLPTALPKGLRLGAYPKREDPRDVLISLKRHTLASLPPGAVVGTGSPRRMRQLLLQRPDLCVKELRGNLDTRVGKAVTAKELDAVVLARAGVRRLNKFKEYCVPLAPDKVYPAIAQGILGIQTRATDRLAQKLVAGLNHRPTEIAAKAERAFLKALEGGCRVPVGIRSKLAGGRLGLRAIVLSVKSSRFLKEGVTGSASSPEGLGRQLARKFLAKGAKNLLNEARAEGGLG